MREYGVCVCVCVCCDSKALVQQKNIVSFPLKYAVAPVEDTSAAELIAIRKFDWRIMQRHEGTAYRK